MLNNEYSPSTEGLQAEPVAAPAAPSRMERALAHAREGWHVFPCHWVLPNGSCSCGKPDCTRKGKHPLTEHGFKDASTDPDQIRRWWTRYPNANIGERTGAASGRDVLDVDPRHGGDETLARQEVENGALPDTLVAKTGGGGLHYVFARTTEGLPTSVGALGPGLDTRGEGGYVMLAGSNHASGGEYAWLNEGTPPADPPAWLIEGTRRKGGDKDAAPPAPRVRRDGRRTEALLILEHCPFVRHCEADAATISYAEWHAMISNLALAKGGPELIHELSALDPKRYDKAETDRQIKSAKEANKPCTYEHIEEKLGFRGCDRWVLRGTVKAPIDLRNVCPYDLSGGPRAQRLFRLQNRYVLVTDINRYHDPADGSDVSPETINSRHAHQTHTGNTHGELVLSRFTAKVDRAEYRPDVAQLVFREGGSPVLNRHVPGDLVPAEGDFGPILRHFEYLFPDGMEREHVLDYLAYGVQNPGKKIGHVIILHGPEGNGKSIIRQVLRLIVGARNLRQLDGDFLAKDNRFKRQLGDCQVLWVEELMQPGRREVANSLKAWITERTNQAEEKNVPGGAVRTSDLFFATTNHDDAVYLGRRDRRWFVATTNPEVRPREYYDELMREDLLRERAAAFAHYLLARNVSRFNPHAPPPMTEAKKVMIKRSRPALADLMEQGAMARAVMTAAEIKKLLADLGAFRPGRDSEGTPTAALKHMGWWSARSVRLDGRPAATWVSPNAPELHGAADEDIRKRWREERGQDTSAEIVSLAGRGRRPA